MGRPSRFGERRTRKIGVVLTESDAEKLRADAGALGWSVSDVLTKLVRSGLLLESLDKLISLDKSAKNGVSLEQSDGISLDEFSDGYSVESSPDRPTPPSGYHPSGFASKESKPDRMSRARETLTLVEAGKGLVIEPLPKKPTLGYQEADLRGRELRAVPKPGGKK